MVNVLIGDDVLYNILSRLPGKPLLRFRCVSKHWNRLISDPYLMKMRSRRMIILPFPRPLVAIDDKAHSMVRIRSPIDHQEEDTRLSLVGTLNNGIVLLSFYDTDLRCHMILYNPLTCESKTLVVMDSISHNNHRAPYALGFGDLKIVRLEFFDYPGRIRYKWDVFDLRTSSWSTPQYLETIFLLTAGFVGVFVNGFLYWSTLATILAFNVKDMVFSEIRLPRGVDNYMGHLLGSLDGCLCMVTKIGLYRFSVWLWKLEQHSWKWKKAYSFAFAPKGNVFYPIGVLANGRILITNSSLELVIYDASTYSTYMALNDLANPDDIERVCEVFNLRLIDEFNHFNDIRPMEYVESLVSPSNMCFI
ncbi:hypothetical protein SSX86_018606 [Deinandra increscens subsp. villosa]|uniref:F-box domain-containing protein n=1 Tax=Deinandra increscens subsp. villosa TaxID=3103831 RepID=A0AAP0GWG4_9ASTR